MPTNETQASTTLLARVGAVSRERETFIRVTLTGDEVSRVRAGCVGGHLKLLVPKADTTESGGLDALRENWRRTCFARTYTLAGHRPEDREIDIEFAVHPGKAGPGGSWARNARVGDRALITIPKGKKLRRTDAGFYLFVCDACSLPAVCAAVVDLPRSAAGLLLVQCDDASDCERFQGSHPGIDVRHLPRDLSVPPSVNAATHLGILRDMRIPAEDTECFVVGESRIVREVKHYVRDVLLLDTDGMYFSAYWKHDHDQDQHKQAKKAEREQEAALVEFPRGKASAGV